MSLGLNSSSACFCTVTILSAGQDVKVKRRREVMKTLCLSGLMLLATACCSQAAAYSPAIPGDYIIKDFRFVSGESLPEVRIHYRTFGKPERDAKGIVRNAVLILHGTGGDGESLMSPAFTDELFGPG